MEVVAQFFTDPLLNSDSVRQARAIRCLQEARQGEAALIEEIGDLADFLQIISENLLQKFLVARQEKQPVVDDLLSLFVNDELKNFSKDILKLELLPQAEQGDPSFLVEPLIDYLTDYLANGIFCQSQTFVFHKTGLQEMFWEFGNLMFNVLPKSIITQDKKIDVTLPNLCDQEIAYSKVIIDSLGILCSMLKIQDSINEFAQQPQELKTENRVFKTLDTNLISKQIVNVVLPFVVRLLQTLNAHVFNKQATQQQLPEYHIPMRIIRNLQISIIYFFQLLYFKNPQLIVPDCKVLDCIVDFLELPLDSREVIISLNILQTVDFQYQSMNFTKLAVACSKLIFRAGGLNVKTKLNADCQLALLNVICRASEQQNAFVVGLCSQFDCAININTEPPGKFQKKAKINGTMIIEADSDSELDIKQRELTPVNVDQDDDNQSVKSENQSENPFLKNRRQQKERSKSPAFTKTIRKEPEISFVEQFLLDFFRLYGEGKFHNSRKLQIYLQKADQQQSVIRQNIIEGHSVNYEQLNIQRVQKMNERTLDFKRMKSQQKENDLKENDCILRSTKYHSIAMNKLVQAETEREVRDKQQFRDFSKQIKRETTYSYNVEIENNEEFSRSIKIPRQLRTTTQICSGIDEELEKYYIFYSLRILANIFHLSKSLPSRQIRLIISNMEAKFVSGVVYFIDKINFLTGPALQLIYDILTFPQQQNSTACLDQWEVFFNNGLLDFVNCVNLSKQLYGAIFICKLLQSAEWQNFIPDERLEQMGTKLINSLVELFCGIIGVSETAEVVLQAVSFLCCCYGSKFGTLLDSLQEKNVKSLNEKLIFIFKQHGHFLTYPAALVVYGLYGMSRREVVARKAYDCGIVKAVLDMFIIRHQNRDELITQSDIVVIRFFSDLCQIADKRLTDYLSTRADFSTAVINMYRFWQQSLDRQPSDLTTGVLLPKAEMIQPKENIARINIFEIAGVQLQNIDDKSIKSPERTVLSPTRARSNVIEIQNRIKQGMDINDSLRPAPVQSQFNEAIVPAPYCDIPEDARYLLKLNVTNTILGYFRSLYPNLSFHQCQITATSDVQKLPKTGRLSQRRPVSGTTPQIGMKIPCLLPNLAVRAEPIINEVEIILCPEDVLVLLQLMGQGLKESLVQLMLGDSDTLIQDDRAFIHQAEVFIEDRISILQKSGQRIAEKLRAESIQKEVDFYQTVRK